MRTSLMLAFSAVILFATGAIAQPPQGPGRPPERGPGGPPDGNRGGERFRLPPNPVIEALDADKNGTVSAEEIAAAATALKSLDRNGDGQLTEDELRPNPPAGGPGRGEGPDMPQRRGGDFNRDPGPGPGPGPGQGRGEGFGRRQPGPLGGPGAHPMPPDGPDQSIRRGGRGGIPRGGDFDRPGGREGEQLGPPRRFDGPEGDLPERPNPAKMIEHMMEFDSNGDGNLSRDELEAFAKEAPMRRGPGPGGPPDDRRPGDDRRPRSDRGPEQGFDGRRPGGENDGPIE